MSQLGLLAIPSSRFVQAGEGRLVVVGLDPREREHKLDPVGAQSVELARDEPIAGGQLGANLFALV